MRDDTLGFQVKKVSPKGKALCRKVYSVVKGTSAKRRDYVRDRFGRHKRQL